MVIDSNLIYYLLLLLDVETTIMLAHVTDSEVHWCLVGWRFLAFATILISCPYVHYKSFVSSGCGYSRVRSTRC